MHKMELAGLLLLSCLACVSCGPASTAKPPSGAAPSATGAAPAPPRAGLERRYFRVHATTLSIDVPAEWGTEIEPNGAPIFTPCSGPPILRLAIRALACPAGKRGDACLDPSQLFSKESLAAAKRTRVGPLREWVAVESDLLGEKHRDESLFTVDAATNTPIVCVVPTLDDETAPRLGMFKAACDSLTLNPQEMPSKPSPAAAPHPSEAMVAPPESEADRAAIAATKELLAAFAKRDIAAAIALSKPTACIRDAASDECAEGTKRTKSVLEGIANRFPKEVDPSWFEIKRNEHTHEVRITMHPKANACGSGLPITLTEQQGKYWFPIRQP